MSDPDEARRCGDPNSTTARGGGLPTPPVWALRRQLAALELDRALDLGEAQAQALLPVLESVRSEVEALEAERAAAEPALAAALAQGIEEVILKGAISGATRAAMRAAAGGFPAALRRRLEAFWRAAPRVLTPEQLFVVGTWRTGGAALAEPGPIPCWSRPDREPFLGGSRALRIMLSDPFVSLVRWRAGWRLLPAARA